VINVLDKDIRNGERRYCHDRRLGKSGGFYSYDQWAQLAPSKTGAIFFLIELFLRKVIKIDATRRQFGFDHLKKMLLTSSKNFDNIRPSWLVHWAALQIWHQRWVVHRDHPPRRKGKKKVRRNWRQLRIYSRWMLILALRFMPYA